MSANVQSRACWALLTVLITSSCHHSDAANRASKSDLHPALPASSAPSPDGAAAQPTADSATQAAVLAELKKDKKLDPARVQVTVKDGIVTLSGSVDNVLSKERATRIAEAVRHVRTVDNRLAVSPVSRPDAEIERDVGKALQFNAATAKLPIAAHVQNGVVRLTGTVGSWQEQKLAERIADHVRGVRFTQNDLITRRTTSRHDGAILADIDTRLKWDVLVEQDPLTATVKDGKVTLTGTVGSASEKSRAMDDAWVDGVTRVDGSGITVDSVHPPDANLAGAAPKKDSDVASAIKDAATYDPRIKSFNFAVQVRDGVATLMGTVDTLNAKLTAEALARNTVGVKDVQNQLAVVSKQPVEDRALETRVKEALIFDPLSDAHDIAVSANAGTVTLAGKVGTFFEKAEVFDTVSALAGVKNVNNRLEVRDQLVPYVYSQFVDPDLPYVSTWYVFAVKPSGTDDEIRHRIEAEFSWNAFVHPESVHVTVDHGKATLTGNVHSSREREAAAQCALEAGAVAIDNELKVS